MATLIQFPLVDPEEKRSAHLGFKTQPEVKAAVIQHADSLRVTSSVLLDSLTRNFLESHGVSGSQTHPLLAAIERLKANAEYALADDCIDDIEQRRLQRDVRDVDALLWPQREAA